MTRALRSWAPVFASSRYTVQLPDKHTFPMDRYVGVQKLLGQLEQSLPLHVLEPEAVCKDDVLTAHDSAWTNSYITGDLTQEERRDIGFPWSRTFVERTLAITGATVHAQEAALRDAAILAAAHKVPAVTEVLIEACSDSSSPALVSSTSAARPGHQPSPGPTLVCERSPPLAYARPQPDDLPRPIACLDDPAVFPAGLGMLACNAAGGTHHAFRDRGEGYCIFNDVAVAVALGMRGMDARGKPGAPVVFRMYRAAPGGDRSLLCEVSVRVRRAAVVDLDVHQGNGTAAMLSPGAQGPDGHGVRHITEPKDTSGKKKGSSGGPSSARRRPYDMEGGREWARETYGDPDGGSGKLLSGRGAFTASLHGEMNYPWRSRVLGSFDRGVPDDVTGAGYLAEVGGLLEVVGDWLKGCWELERKMEAATGGDGNNGVHTKHGRSVHTSADTPDRDQDLDAMRPVIGGTGRELDSDEYSGVRCRIRSP